MRVVCISDTHLRHKFDVPPGDVLIHAGDATIVGSEQEFQRFFDWFGKLPHPHKVLIAGNHDWLFEKLPEDARALIPPGITYLQDELATVNGLKIYGSPWQPEFMGWAFNLPRGWPMKKKWELIPAGIDILVTHGPPLGFLDFSPFGTENAGCADLRNELLRVKPKLHVFGHIHHGYGQTEWNGIKLVNASICDEAYRPSNKPIVLELP